jgi:hypothetical protein
VEEVKVNEQKPIEFVNDCNARFDKQQLEAAVLWFQKEPTARLKHIYMHGRYPAVSIHNIKIHVHRLLAMFNAGEIIPSQFHIHHIDGDKLNASIDNLEVMPSYLHMQKTRKGVGLSEEHRKKISNANRKRKGIKMKKRGND